jgi:signal transduction histidine kinase
MIAPRALNSLSFPWVLMDRGGLLAEGSGALFPKPNYETSSILATCTEIADRGWAVCPNGYALHRFTTNVISPSFVVLHGLKIQGLSKAKGRVEQLSINLTQADIDSYVQEYCIGLESLDDQYRALIRQNIHEVRGINSALYNTAFELQELLETDFSHRGTTTSLAKSVVSLSELLRGRIDFMEFIANPSTKNVTRGDIYVYRKFDKVQRCFRVTANKRGIDFSISGASSKSTFGPPIFDLVPYLLLDNAVKYSPDKFPVQIVCNDGANSIFCSVTSRGPRITATELPDIFSPGVRGENALKSKKEGSGLGLSVLRVVVDEVFGGSIQVTQSEDKAVINGVPYCDVTFEIRLPTKAVTT